MTPLLGAFADELVKLADYAVTGDLAEAERAMKPGDILATQPRQERLDRLGFGHKLLRPFLRHIQGTDYTHIGMYIGDGKVIDSQERGIKTTPLAAYDKDFGFRVLRVDATPAERRDAVEYAKKQVGKPFNTFGMLRLALPVYRSETGRHGPRERQDAAESLFCSQLVANAYPGQPFSAGKKIHHVRPVDIQRSPLTRIVIEKE